MDYQRERQELEVDDQTRLLVVAMYNKLGSGAEPSTVLETSEIAGEINSLAEKEGLWSGRDAERPFIQTMSVGKMLRRHRFSRAPAGRTKRRWLIRRADIERIATTHGISLVPESNAESAESAESAEVSTERASPVLQVRHFRHLESEHSEDPANDDIDVQAELLRDLLEAESSAE